MLFLSFRLTKAALPQFVVANGFIFFAVVQRKMCDLFKKSLRNQSPETSCRFTNDLFDFLVFPLFIYIYIYININIYIYIYIHIYVAIEAYL